MTLSLTIEFTPAQAERLIAISKSKGVNGEAVVRRALALYDLIHEEMQDGHDVVFVKDGKAVKRLEVE